MIGEIICVGTELLLGNIINTNAAYIATECAKLGIDSYYQTVVGDNEGRLLECLELAKKRSDVVFLSGGLGPTKDDLTKEVVARFCQKELVVDETSMERIAEYFTARNIKPTENNWKQAMVPQGALVFQNNNGTAPGLMIEDDGCRWILLPGPPNELVPMFQESVIPYLLKLTNKTISSCTVKICGIGESQVETMVSDLIEKQSNPTIATYAKTGEVHIRVTASKPTVKEAEKLIKPVVKELKSRFGNAIYTTDEAVTLEKSVVDLLIANDLRISLAESCTGGLLSSRLVNVPGVSEVYFGGHITYANKAKKKILGVKKSTLQKYGAVSRETAEEMVKGLLTFSKADVGLAITGIAGPDGGTAEKPVGLVYIACNVKGNICIEEYRFKGNREKIRESAASAAFMLARKCILEYFSKMTFGKKSK